jgi:hypothetical protein
VSPTSGILSFVTPNVSVSKVLKTSFITHIWLTPFSRPYPRARSGSVKFDPCVCSFRTYDYVRDLAIEWWPSSIWALEGRLSGANLVANITWASSQHRVPSWVELITQSVPSEEREFANRGNADRSYALRTPKRLASRKYLIGHVLRTEESSCEEDEQ